MHNLSTGQNKTLTHPKKSKPGPKLALARAVVLRSQGLSYNEIGKILGWPHSTAHSRLSKMLAWVQSPEIIEQYQNSRANLLTSAELQMVQAMMDPESIAKASLNNRAYAFTQVHNARRLEEGKSTSNVSYADFTRQMSDLDREIAELEREIGSQKLLQNEAVEGDNSVDNSIPEDNHEVSSDIDV